MLKIVLFDFNGVIINDEAIHQQLLNDIILEENLRPISWGERQQFCLGKSDRVCLQEFLTHRGRSVSEDYLNGLVTKKAKRYRSKLDSLESLPIYPGVQKFIEQIQLRQIPLGLVTGSVRSEVLNVLEKSELLPCFSVIVTGDEITTSKPQPDGYLLAVEKFNQLDSSLQLTPQDCLAIEDSLVGIQAAKTAGMSVVGIAHTFPYHFIQRYANWAIDSFSQLDLDRVRVVLSRRSNDDLSYVS